MTEAPFPRDAATAVHASIVDTPDGPCPLMVVFSERDIPILTMSVTCREEAADLVRTMLARLASD